MPKFFRFTTLSLRDLSVTFGPPLLLVIMAGVIAYRIIDPSPPKRVTISAGQENSAYENLAKRYATLLAKEGIEVKVIPSEGSLENLERLKNPDSTSLSSTPPSRSHSLANRARKRCHSD